MAAGAGKRCGVDVTDYKNQYEKECAACAAKPGSPALCESCLHNRTLVANLKDQIDKLEARASDLELLILTFVTSSRFEPQFPQQAALRAAVSRNVRK